MSKFIGLDDFTPDDKEDGLLTSDEIIDLKLNASLVVLSACDTGRGKVRIRRLLD